MAEPRCFAMCNKAGKVLHMHHFGGVWVIHALSGGLFNFQAKRQMAFIPDAMTSIGCHSSASNTKCEVRIRMSQEQFSQELPNFTRTSMLAQSTATPDMMSPATPGQHLSKIEKTTESAASDGLGRILVVRRFA